MAVTREKKATDIIEICDPIDNHEQYIKAVTRLVKDSVERKELIIILAQHLHQETYDLIKDNAGKTEIKLMLSSESVVDYNKLDREKIDKNQIVDLNVLKEKGVEIHLIDPKDINFKYMPNSLPRLWVELWSSPSSLVHMYPHPVPENILQPEEEPSNNYKPSCRRCCLEEKVIE